jgi:hypothetical protein
MKPATNRALSGVLVVSALVIILIASGSAAASETHTQHVGTSAPTDKTAVMAPLSGAHPKPKAVLSAGLAAYEREQAMSNAQLMARWEALIGEASKRFGIPDGWIREVMRIESGGRTMLSPTTRMISSKGALGLMQVQAKTYDDMRDQYGLGQDPFDAHDNVMAGAAYLRWLESKYGYPAMFAAYNDGPANFELRMMTGALMPSETHDYVRTVTAALGDAGDTNPAQLNSLFSGRSTDNADLISCYLSKPANVTASGRCGLVTGASRLIAVGVDDLRVHEYEDDVMRVAPAHGGH